MRTLISALRLCGMQGVLLVGQSLFNRGIRVGSDGLVSGAIRGGGGNLIIIKENG